MISAVTRGGKYISDTVLESFAKIESATITEPDELVSVHNSRTHHADIETLSLGCVPSKHSLRWVISAVHGNRPPGPDGMVPDDVSIDPATSSNMLHPFMLELATAREEPFMAKGTLATDIYKGSGSHEIIATKR